MTKLELMKQNKKRYAELEEKIESLSGIERDVAKHLTLNWIKGAKWEGGLGSGQRGQRCYERLMKMGYSFDEIDAEFDRQMNWYDD